MLVAHGLLFDDAFNEAGGNGHAGGLDDLQVAGSEQVQCTAAGRVGASALHQLADTTDTGSRRSTHQRDRIGRIE